MTCVNDAYSKFGHINHIMILHITRYNNVRTFFKCNRNNFRSFRKNIFTDTAFMWYDTEKDGIKRFS